MEVLASLHHALAYENPDDLELTIAWNRLSPIKKLDPSFGHTATPLLSIACSLAILSTANTASARTLQRGDEGQDVLQLQYSLNDHGYFAGPFTGYYGSLTEEAVITFQEDSSYLSIDGIAGSETKAALGLSGGNGSPSGISSITGSKPGGLKFGSTGPIVKQLQYDLADAGYYNAQGPFTEYFGDLTESAVLELQADYGLIQDGIVGSATLNALKDSLGQTGTIQVSTSSGSTLKFGSTGAAVKQLQYDLADAGYYNTNGPFTEYFGELTEGAVLELQAAYGLKQDGVVGPATRNALDDALGTGTGSTSSSGTSNILKYGSTGSSVKQLQQDLVKAGVYNPGGPFTEYFGELTEAAVGRLQAYYGLKQDGVVGPQTYKAIEEAIAQGGIPPYGSSNRTSSAPSPAPSPEATQSEPPAPAPVEPSPNVIPAPSPVPTVGESVVPSGSEPSPLPSTPSTSPSPSRQALVGYIRLKEDLAAYDAPNGTPINYLIGKSQVIGYFEDRKDGWIRVEVPGDKGSWIFAEGNYSKVEFITPAGVNPSPSLAPGSPNSTGVTSGWNQLDELFR